MTILYKKGPPCGGACSDLSIKKQMAINIFNLITLRQIFRWTLEKKWNITANPRIMPNMDTREQYKEYLIANIGNEYGGRCRFPTLLPSAAHERSGCCKFGWSFVRWNFLQEKVCKLDRIFIHRLLIPVLYYTGHVRFFGWRSAWKFLLIPFSMCFFQFAVLPTPDHLWNMLPTHFD